jgi:hypothetical protein
MEAMPPPCEEESVHKHMGDRGVLLGRGEVSGGSTRETTENATTPAAGGKGNGDDHYPRP